MSGASLFSTLTKYEGAYTVMIGNAQFLPISHVGSVQLITRGGFITLNNFLHVITLNNFLHVPLLKQKLLPISQLNAESPYTLTFLLTILHNA